jgi:AcrR family transcriptional regulator
VILDAALALFAERGYEGTAMDEVARRAGVTKPVLYDHFPSKDALYAVLLRREAAAMVAATVAELDPKAPLDERLRAVAAAAVTFAREQPATSRLLAQTPVGDASVLEAHRGIRADRRRATAAAILADPAFRAQAGLSRGATAELLGDLHNAALERLVAWALEHPRASVDALAELYVRTLF